MCYDGHTPGESQRRRLAICAEEGFLMELANLQQEPPQHASVFYHENPVTQQMLLYAANQACAYASQAAAACTEYSRVAVENERLQHQLDQRQAAEEAYRYIVENDGSVYTFGKTRQPVEILNCCVSWALHVLPQPPFSQPPFFMIGFAGVEPPLVLSERDYLCDKEFLQKIEELPGTKVGRAGSQRRTADLLRQAINQKIQTAAPAFFGGWRRGEDGCLRFFPLPPCTTHADGKHVTFLSNPIDPPSPAVAEAAVQQFLRCLQAVREPVTRKMLAVWLHAAALCSLLEQLGHPMPLALGIVAADPNWLEYLGNIFCWYGDPPLSLDDPSSLFSNGLLCRKDQPLLVLDHHRTKESETNCKQLEEVLAYRKILWKCGRKSEWFPLQAIPLILSPSASSLCCSPEVMVLEVSPDDFDLAAASSQKGNIGAVLHEYLGVFIGWTAGHIDRLRDMLETGAQQARMGTHENLTESCVKAWGVLLGISSFLADFLRCTAADTSAFRDADDEWEEQLLELLVQTAEKALDGSDYAAQFLEIARSCLISGTLSACPTEYTTPPPEKVVFFDDGALYFTSYAFRHVCQRLSQSCPVVVRALRQAGVLQGRPVNATTGLTRVSVWNQYGTRESRQVYKLPRKAFDQLGDPLILGEEEVR